MIPACVRPATSSAGPDPVSDRQLLAVSESSKRCLAVTDNRPPARVLHVTVGEYIPQFVDEGTQRIDRSLDCLGLKIGLEEPTDVTVGRSHVEPGVVDQPVDRVIEMRPRPPAFRPRRMQRLVGQGLKSSDNIASRHTPRLPGTARPLPPARSPASRQQARADVRSAVPRPDRHQIFAITCPLHVKEEWRRLKRRQPALFARACWLEAVLNNRRRELGRDPVWLTRHARPLAETVDDQLSFDDLHESGCDSGWCFA